jgi:benzoyl-CoA reductase/2-hydroxyglutaryl-CoA dehydratase subunit BcrC/BadD/HgdB
MKPITKPNIEKRKYLRLEKALPVRFKLDQMPFSFEAVTGNISEGGMMLRLNPAEKSGLLLFKQKLNIEFNLPSTATSFKTIAQIVWVKEPIFGIEFVRTHSSHRKGFSLFIKQILEQETREQATGVVEREKVDKEAVVEIEAETLIDQFVEMMEEEAAKQRTSTLSFGWFYSYVPEEILCAAGFIPYRIMGKPGPIIKAKASLSGNLNPFVQTCLESALQGDYQRFSGVIIGNADDASRRLYDVWKKYINPPFIHILDIPKTTELAAIGRYRMELTFLIKRLEEHFKIQITSESLEEASNLCNETRRLLTALYLLRKKHEYLISSNQFLAITLASMTVAKDFFNQHLEILLRELESLVQERNFLRNDFKLERKPRLLLTGSFQNNSTLATIIDEAGGKLVCEDMCTRLRYFTGLVDTTIDEPLLAISMRYLTKPPGARMLDLNRRFEYIDSLIEEFKVDGVIYYVLKFDDPYLFEFPEAREWLQSKDIPVLLLESDHRFATLGQFRTRIQAFIETLTLRLGI